MYQETNSLIIVTKTNPRIEYIFRFILEDILGLTISFQTSTSSNLNHIEYSPSSIQGFKSIELLFETSLDKKWNVYFEKQFISSDCHNLPDDVFASSFFLISRYEEYFDFIPDKYGRFQAKDSVLVKTNLHLHPVVNYWITELEKSLRILFPSFVFNNRRFRKLLSYDIDNAWAYKNKGLRGLGLLSKSLLQLKFKSFKTILLTLLNKYPDPYDTFNELTSTNMPSIYFFLLANRDTHDRNINYDNKDLNKLIQFLNNKHLVGIHPSFASFSSPSLISLEINRLNNILNTPITHSRFHFLRFTIPYSYHELIKNGIKNDYTMGWASHPGFRAGIAEPFFFYDLSTETKTELKIYPFAVMDGTLAVYQNKSATESLQIIKELIRRVKLHNGIFIPLFHNETLSKLVPWVGWDYVHNEMKKELEIE